jgi:DNA mismatch repair protein MutS2
MLQCGMLIPVHGDSVAGVFNNIFLNIGDDQSLENDLSTYSSHLLNISFFLKNSDNKTLFLIDEFGAGTEPSLGGAIAEAALLELNNKKAFGIVTTHYANIKLLADNNAGIINASMLFDIKNLKPLYILKTGNPGSSFAFEIAAKTGFPKEVLKIAAQKTLNSHLDFEKQLNDIDAKNNILEKKQKELDVADSFLKEIIDKYTLLKDQLENNKDLILNKAKKEARQILDNANSIIENTIREIKESEANALKIKILRNNIENLKQEMTVDEKNVFSEENKASNKVNPKKNTHSKLFKQPLIKTLNKKPEAGEMVKLTGQSWVGELVEIKGNMGVVASGVIKMKVPLENIKTVDILNSEIPKTANTQKYNFSDNINEKAAMFKHQLDLRGIRKQEALELLNKYIDDAILLHIDEVYILHGKGNGVLRQAVREYLSNITEVKKMRDQQIELGGSGITIVNFK